MISERSSRAPRLSDKRQACGVSRFSHFVLRLVLWFADSSFPHGELYALRLLPCFHMMHGACLIKKNQDGSQLWLSLSILACFKAPGFEFVGSIAQYDYVSVAGGTEKMPCTAKRHIPCPCPPFLSFCVQQAEPRVARHCSSPLGRRYLSTRKHRSRSFRCPIISHHRSAPECR